MQEAGGVEREVSGSDSGPRRGCCDSTKRHRAVVLRRAERAMASKTGDGTPLTPHSCNAVARAIGEDQDQESWSVLCGHRERDLW